MRHTTLGAGTLLLVLACGQASDDVSVHTAPTLIFPKGVLDQVTTLTLRAFDSSLVTCDTERGLGNGDTSNPIIEETLSSDGCPAGTRFCGDVVIKRSSTPYVFVASATDDSDHLLASGCDTQPITEARASLTIQMHRFLEPAVCGNGKLEPTELCDPPGQPDDSVCDSQCKTKEVLLSNGRGTTGGTANGKPGDKERPTLVWPLGTGTNAKLLAFFSDKSGTTLEVTGRVRSDAFGRFSSQGAEVADYSFFLPNIPSAKFPPAESAKDQSSPAAVSAGNGQTWIAFEDNPNNDLDIRLRSIDATLTAEQTDAIRINGTTTGEAGNQSLPAIAINKSGILFVAWQDDRDGSIQGRTYNPADGTRGATRVLSSGSANKNVRVTGVGTGFVATWEAGADVRLAHLSPDGTPSPEEKVNGAAHTGPVSHPDVAALADGRFAIVFSDRGDIFVQRYNKDGKQIAGDQATPVNAVVTAGDQYAPVIAPMAASSGSYAIAWIDGASSDVRAAYLGGNEGVLFNPIDGQATEFLASATPGRRRANPAIAVGGTGPFVAIAWEDTTSDAKAGIYGRRLPGP